MSVRKRIRRVEPTITAPIGKEPESAPVAGALAEDYVAVLITGLANRLNRGASNYYRKHWKIGIAEWRIILCLGKKTDLSVVEIAEAADLDNAAASRSLKVLKNRNLVNIEQTSRRGRAAIVSLSAEGIELQAQLKIVARERQERLLSGFDGRQIAELCSLLRKLIDRVPYMNRDD
jgi:DNA-binding MarR family transcriptional regulator